MPPGELAAVLSAHPTTPLRLYLTSGANVHVDDAGRTVIRGSLLYVNAAADERLTVERRSKVISIAHIEMVEPRVVPKLGTLRSDGGSP
jgi:hypothetical protein